MTFGINIKDWGIGDWTTKVISSVSIIGCIVVFKRNAILIA